MTRNRITLWLLRHLLKLCAIIVKACLKKEESGAAQKFLSFADICLGEIQVYVDEVYFAQQLGSDYTRVKSSDELDIHIVRTNETGQPQIEVDNMEESE